MYQFHRSSRDEEMAAVPPRPAFININPLDAPSPPNTTPSMALAWLRQAIPTGSQALNGVFPVRTEIEAGGVRDSEYSLHAPPRNDVNQLFQPRSLGAVLQQNDPRIAASAWSRFLPRQASRSWIASPEVKANTVLIVSTQKYPPAVNANSLHHHNHQPQ
jgi:hypothetical protein